MPWFRAAASIDRVTTQAGIRAAGRGIRPTLSPIGIDLAFALAVTVVTVWGCYSESNPSSQGLRVLDGRAVTPAPAWASLLVAMAGLALVWRRRYPRAVFGVSMLGVLASAVLGHVSD